MGSDSEGSDRFYVGHALYVQSGAASGQIATITDFKGAFHGLAMRVFVYWWRVELPGVPRRATAPFRLAPDSTSKYLVTPYVVVVQPSGFAASRSLVACNVTSGVVATGLDVFAEE
eukprot:1367114-Rhodomonas_salina.1